MQNDSAKDKALIIYSGGMDSTVCLYLAMKKYKYIETISFDYSQKHKIELTRAKKILKLNSIKNTLIKIPKELFVGSSLTDNLLKVPKKALHKNKLPNTYVPGRNILFLSFAVSFAEGRGIKNIFLGVNALDYSGYPDCRPEFIDAFQKSIDLGTRGIGRRGVKIHTPLVLLSKKEIVQLADSLEVPLDLTHSCYDPQGGKPCGECDSCILRRRGIQEAGLTHRYRL